MGIFKCNRTEKYKSEQLFYRDPYTNEIKIVSYSLQLSDYDNTYFNTKHIVRFRSKTCERSDNYTTYQLILVYHFAAESHEITIEYFDEDERDRDLKILIRMMEND